MSNPAGIAGTQAAVTEKNTDQAVGTTVRVAKAALSATTVEKDPLKNNQKLLLNNLSQKARFLRLKAEFTCHHLE
ncbi:MAG: hypothetical protein ACKO96_47245 [Flammeovirgaceae bacterium]